MVGWLVGLLVGWLVVRFCFWVVLFVVIVVIVVVAVAVAAVDVVRCSLFVVGCNMFGCWLLVATRLVVGFSLIELFVCWLVGGWVVRVCFWLSCLSSLLLLLL